MSGIPPLPPLRIKEADGSPNVIPVFTIVASNMAVTNLGGGTVRLDASGSQGPAGPAGTLTLGSGITGGASDGYLLMVGCGNVLGQVSSSYFVNTGRTISAIFPVSGGGDLSINRTVSVDTLFLLNTARQVLTAVGLSGGGNLSADRTLVADTLLLVTSGRSVSTTYPVAGGGNLSADRTITVDTLFLVNTGRQVTGANGLTGGGNLATDQVIRINTTGSGEGLMLITSGGSALGGVAWVNTGGGSGSGTVTAGSGGNLAYYPSNGTTVDDLLIGSAMTLVGVNSSGAKHEYFVISGSNNATVTYAGTTIYISANTGTGASTSGVVYAPTGGNYVAYAADANLTQEKVLTAGSSVTIVTDATAIYINALTNPAGAGGVQTVRIPMALLTVKINSANAYYTAKSGTQVDAAHVQFVDSGLGISTYWCEVPFNIASTANWNLVMRHEPDSGTGGNVAMTVCAQVVSDGSVLDANTTVLISARSFATYAAGTLALTKITTGVIDNTLGLAQGQTLYVIAQRLGGNAGDTVNAPWNLKYLALECNANS